MPPFKKGHPPLPKKNAIARNAKPESTLVLRARAANFIADMAAGMSQPDVARKYQVHVSTVKNALRFAERENFFQKAEDAILHRLVPKAIDAYEKALDKAISEGDYDAAEKLLKGVRLFASGGPARDQVVEKDDDDGPDEVTWERFTAKRRNSPEANPTNHPHSPTVSSEPGTPGGLPTVDATIIREAGDEAGLHGVEQTEPARAEGDSEADGNLHAGTPPSK